MQIDILPPVGDNYLCLLHDGREAVAVDPREAAPVLAAVRERGLVLRACLITHHHADHTGGCADLRREPGCAVLAPDDARIPAADRRLRGGERLHLLGAAFDVLHVPGHTRSHLAYHAPDVGAVWTGDTLFVGGCGRLLEGTPRELWESLCRLAALPADTRVYCGHNYAADNLEFALELEPDNTAVAARLGEMRRRDAVGQPTIPGVLADERVTNPFLRCGEANLRAALRLPRAPAWEVFAELRRRKDAW